MSFGGLMWGSLASPRLVSARRRVDGVPPAHFSSRTFLVRALILEGFRSLAGFFAGRGVSTSRGSCSAPRRSSWRAHGSAPGPRGPALGGARLLSPRPPWRKKTSASLCWRLVSAVASAAKASSAARRDAPVARATRDQGHDGDRGPKKIAPDGPVFRGRPTAPRG